MGFITRRSTIRRGSRGTRADKPDRGANLKTSSKGYKPAESNIYKAVKEGSPYSKRGVYLPAYTVSRLPDILQGTGMSLTDIEHSSRYNSDFAERLESILESEVEILAAHGALVRAKNYQSGGLKLRKIEQTDTKPSKFRLAYEALKQRLESQNNA